jgi:chromosome segregation ATPase
VTATEELQNRNASLAQQTGELRAQLEESQNVCQNLLEQKDIVTEEKSLAVQELDRATKLAEKRKAMVDELSIKSQHEAEEVQKQLKTLQNEHEAVVHTLKTELQSEQEKRQGLIANTQQHEMTEKELQKLKEKLAVTEEEKEYLKKQVERAIADGKQAVEDLQAEVEKLKAEVAAAQHETTELENKMTAQEQIIHDKEAEMKLSEKKGAALMKDLKRQLQQEKRHCERLQEQLTEVQKMKLHDDNASLSTPSELFRPPSRDGSLSSLTGSVTAGSVTTQVSE